MSDFTKNYLFCALYMLAILIIIGVRAFIGLKQKQSKKRCLGLISFTFLYVLVDALYIVVDLSSPKPIFLFKVMSYLFYLSYVLLAFAWHIFVRNYVGVGVSKKVKRLELIPLFLMLFLVLINPFTHIIWKIDDTGTYNRGNLFLLFAILHIFYYAEPLIDLIVIYLTKRIKKEAYVYQSLFISLMPFIASLTNDLIIPEHNPFYVQKFLFVSCAVLAYFFMSANETDFIQKRHQAELQKALNEAEIAKEKALEASKVKTTFLSNMSHDIRTPMNAIINVTNLALQENDINIIKDYLDKISISSNFLLGLINDILDMSRIESGEFTLHKSSLTRSEFLNTVETVVMPLMDSKHIHFHPELNPGEYTISVDKLRFNQIFFNLLSNAAKFTPDGGDVWFEVTNLETKDNKLKIRFVVRDNGIGMSEEFLKHIYEPFSREYSDKTQKITGTGLGLPIVKSLVEAMDGTISVKSKLGEGSEFTVEFFVDIVSKNEIVEEKVDNNNNNNLSGMRVLLVEDNEMNTYVEKIILEQFGCVVTTADNGQAALDLFEKSDVNSFDVIIMDVRMPIMDGIEATKKIRALDRSDAKSINIIAMTADAFDNERKNTIEAGMNYHLAKPVDANKLHEVLNKCVNNK